MPFHSEDNPALEQAGQRGVVQFLSLTLSKTGTVLSELITAPALSRRLKLEVPSNLHYPMILSSGSGRGSILGRCVERSVRCRCMLMYQASTCF